MSGFFREVMDLEGGFWPTLQGFTLQPGRTLRRYLSGARRSYMHPGRYLLAAIVVATLLVQAMTWTGVTTQSSISERAAETVAEDTAATTESATDSSSVAYRLGYRFGRLLAPEDAPADSAPTGASAAADGQAQTAGSGARSDSGSESEAGRETGSAQDASASHHYVSDFFALLGDHYFKMTMAVVMAFFLGLVYRQLFPDSISGLAPAVAAGLFVTAHATILETLLVLPFRIGSFLQHGHPVEWSADLWGTLGLFTWSGIVTGGAFGTTWRSTNAWWIGLKGFGGAVLAYLDSVGFLLLLIGVYAGSRYLWSGTTGGDNPVLIAVLTAVLGIGVFLFFVPHLLLFLFSR